MVEEVGESKIVPWGGGGTQSLQEIGGAKQGGKLTGKWDLPKQRIGGGGISVILGAGGSMVEGD